MKDVRVEGLSAYWTTTEAAAARQQRSIDPVGAWLDTREEATAAESLEAPGVNDIAAEDALLPWLDCELRVTVVMGGELCPVHIKAARRSPSVHCRRQYAMLHDINHYADQFI